MRKSSSNKLTGNNQFEGYTVDLTEEISRILGFNYTFRIVPDGRYGSLNRATNEWDGMIKELLEQVRLFYLNIVKYIDYRNNCGCYFSES